MYSLFFCEYAFHLCVRAQREKYTSFKTSGLKSSKMKVKKAKQKDTAQQQRRRKEAHKTGHSAARAYFS